MDKTVEDTRRIATLFNGFVMGTIPDGMGVIFDNPLLFEMAVAAATALPNRHAARAISTCGFHRNDDAIAVIQDRSMPQGRPFGR